MITLLAANTPTQCKEVLSVGSGSPCSIRARRIPDKYTLSVLHEICHDAWAQKYSSVNDDAGNSTIPN